MGGLVDTNILLYAANSAAPEHARAARFLLAAGNSPDRWYITEGILYEFLRVATHPAVLPRPLSWQEATAFLAPIVEGDAFAILSAGEQHWDLLRQEMGRLGSPAGNLFFDIRTVILMREHGIRTIHTADTDFLQFDGIEVVNPLRG